MALIGLGAGMIITSLTTKYRDLVFLLTFGTQLLMYATPIIYPMSKIPQKYQWLIQLNPLSSIIETFRFAYTGRGVFSWMALLLSSIFSIVLLFASMVVFNRVEKSFMDTV
jgi:lipopolysaccharide transport system permease protein